LQTVCQYCRSNKTMGSGGIFPQAKRLEISN